MIEKYNNYCKEMKEKGEDPLSYGYWVAKFDPYRKEREERETKEYIAKRKKEREMEAFIPSFFLYLGDNDN